MPLVPHSVSSAISTCFWMSTVISSDSQTRTSLRSRTTNEAWSWWLARLAQSCRKTQTSRSPTVRATNTVSYLRNRQKHLIEDPGKRCLSINCTAYFDYAHCCFRDVLFSVNWWQTLLASSRLPTCFIGRNFSTHKCSILLRSTVASFCIRAIRTCAITSAGARQIVSEQTALMQSKTLMTRDLFHVVVWSFLFPRSHQQHLQHNTLEIDSRRRFNGETGYKETWGLYYRRFFQYFLEF